jgi:hypothetical protein
VVVVIVVLVLAAVAVLLLCFFLKRKKSDKVAAAEEEDHEVKASPAEENSEAIEPPQEDAAEADPEAGESKKSKKKAKKKSKKSPRGEAEAGDSDGGDHSDGPEAADDAVAEEGTAQPAEGEGTHHHKKGSRAKKGGRAEADDKPKEARKDGEDANVIETEPILVTAALGQRSSVDVPFEAQLWTRADYEAHFEPKPAELWISSDRGVIEPGATELPFKLFFEPSSGDPLETTLIVTCDAFETHTRIQASVEKRRRRHGQ